MTPGLDQFGSRAIYCTKKTFYVFPISDHVFGKRRDSQGEGFCFAPVAYLNELGRDPLDKATGKISRLFR